MTKHSYSFAPKLFLLVFGLLMSSLSICAQTVKHEVKAGETLYSISRAYGIGVSDIKAVNKNLTDNIMAGQRINIPVKNAAVETTAVGAKDATIAVSQATHHQEQVPATTIASLTDDGELFKVMYEVKKKDTFYSIAKQYSLTTDELLAANPTVNSKKLKKGQLLRIPYTQEELAARMAAQEKETEVIEKEHIPVSFAVIMPFGLAESNKKNREIITMVDFYEGVMLALADLKRSGVSANIHVYDETQIDSVLALAEMKNMDLIIGPGNANNIERLSNFTEANNIKLVVPISSDANLVDNKRNVFQVNTKLDANTTERGFEEFTNVHAEANYIFVNIEDQQDKEGYVVQLKNHLREKGTKFSNVDFKDITDKLDSLLVSSKENVIVSSSSTKTAFDRLTRRIAEIGPSKRITLFGYADWQVFAAKSMDMFQKYRCSFFSTFYHNPNSDSTLSFNRKFHRAFGRDQYSTFPQYGMLGYEITSFFVGNIYEFGDEFMVNISELRNDPLQNPLHFVHKNSWSGFVNDAVVFVSYNADGTISIKNL